MIRCPGFLSHISWFPVRAGRKMSASFQEMCFFDRVTPAPPTLEGVGLIASPWQALPHVGCSSIDSWFGKKGKLAIQSGVSSSILPCCGSVPGQNNNSNNKQTNKRNHTRVCRPFVFVCSSTCLTVRTKTYRWVDECIVLLLLTCLRLYEFAVSMFLFLFSFLVGLVRGQGSGVWDVTEKGQNPLVWEKKGKVRFYHVTYVTVDCNSLPELIKL